MPSETTRHAIKVLGAASLVGISSLVGSPIAGSLVMAVGAPVIDALAGEGVDYLAGRQPFRQHQVLNHDLQRAFQQAFQKAVRRLEHQWWETLGKTTPGNEREPVKTFFDLLGRDAAWAFSDEQYTELVHSAAGLVDSGHSLDRVITEQVERYLYGHNERLVQFMGRKLLDEVSLCFTEELKTNNRAWRAYQQSVNEGVQAALLQLLQKQDQLAARYDRQVQQLIEALEAKQQELETLAPDERDAWGAAALDRVHEDLATRIAAEAERTRSTVREEAGRIRDEVRRGHDSLHGKLDEGFSLLLTQLQKQSSSLTAAELLRHDAHAGRQVWRVPRSRSPHFAGRETVLASMVAEASERRAAPLVQALLGMGGLGKSQLAAEVAYRRADACRLVWWVRAETPTTVVSDLADLAAELDLPAARFGNQDEAASAARRWLEELHDPWLLIFDNAEEPETLKPWLPTRGNGHILVTSRVQTWRQVATPIALSVLDSEAARGFLLQRTGQADGEAAAALAEELGQLPLALEQAAAFIDETGTALADYLDLIRSSAGTLLGKHDDVSRTGASVTTVWHASIAAVTHASPEAGRLLRLCAFLAPEGIPLDLLGAKADMMPDDLAAVFQDAMATTEAVGTLYRYSLANVDDDRSISIHRLVQLAVRESLSEEDRRVWAGIAVTVMQAAFPFDETRPETWRDSEALLAHALAACDGTEVELGAPQAAGELLARAGGYLRARGQFLRARPLLERAYQVRLTAQDTERADLANLLSEIGDVRCRLGDVDGARDAYEQALDLDSTFPHASHLRLMGRWKDLGSVLTRLEDAHRARFAREQALAHAIAFHQPDHPDVMTCRDDLNRVWGINRVLTRIPEDELRAMFLDVRDRYEEQTQRDIEIHGPDHPLVAIRHGTLAHVHGELASLSQGQERRDALSSKQRKLERALAIELAAYGPEHPNVAETRRELGGTLSRLDKQRQARHEIAAALEIDLAHFGPDQRQRAVRQSVVAMELAIGLHRSTEILQLHRSLLERAQAAYGHDHPAIAEAHDNLGRKLALYGKHREARHEHERVLDLTIARLGADHPDVADVRWTLGEVLLKQGDLAESRAEIERALAIGHAALGPESGRVSMYRYSLRKTLKRLGDHAAVIHLCERELARIVAIEGAGGGNVAALRIDLGEALFKLGDHEAARRELELALRHYRRHGPKEFVSEIEGLLRRLRVKSLLGRFL